jgi:hypothetical protein
MAAVFVSPLIVRTAIEMEVTKGEREREREREST